MTNTADLYLRLSLDFEGATSIDRQEADCRRWCDAHGLSVRRVHVDRGVSGFSGSAHRAGSDAAVAAVTAAETDTLVVWKLDRLSRRGVGQVGQLLDLLEQAGGRLVSGTFRAVPARPRFPTDHEPMIDVRAALGRFDDFAAVVGTQRPDARGFWGMAFRDSRVRARERPTYMRAECSTKPGPGVLVYVDDVAAGWCSIAPRASYRRLLNSRTIPVLDERDAWIAVCFVVARGTANTG